MSALGRLTGCLDLREQPWSLPGSRIVVSETDDGLSVALAEYERPLNDCIVVDEVRVATVEGRPVPLAEVHVHAVHFERGGSLTFDGPRAVSLGGFSVPVVVHLSARATVRAGDGSRGSWAVALPHAARATIAVDAHVPGAGMVDADRTVTVRLPVGAALVVALDGGLGAHAGGPDLAAGHAARLARTRAVWQTWMARCPDVAEPYVDVTALCWWVLGVNQVVLEEHGEALSVVPSLAGYVAHWQWDAYFIAIGLAHGAPELAREQLDLALSRPGPDGQLPDVLSDEGVLASSADLPEADRASLRRAASAVAEPTAPIPLTKPPLAAWAVDRVARSTGADAAWVDRAMAVVGASQEWWFAHGSRSTGAEGADTLPVYAHPYSSGLDDCPVFDHQLPVVSPDLAAYLVVQDLLLARHAAAKGTPTAREVAQAGTVRAQRTLALLEELWRAGRGYTARAEGRDLPERTVVGLLPLLTGRLAPERARAVVESMGDPEGFGTPWPVATVAASDPSFAPERMWRGPVWVNMNALLVEGLAVSGFPDEARALAEQTVRLVARSGGPSEYYDPRTGRRAPGAAVSFGWTAALTVDLAVRLSMPGGITAGWSSGVSG